MRNLHDGRQERADEGPVDTAERLSRSQRKEVSYEAEEDDGEGDDDDGEVCVGP